MIFILRICCFGKTVQSFQTDLYTTSTVKKKKKKSIYSFAFTSNFERVNKLLHTPAYLQVWFYSIKICYYKYSHRFTLFYLGITEIVKRKCILNINFTFSSLSVLYPNTIFYCFVNFLFFFIHIHTYPHTVYFLKKAE